MCARRAFLFRKRIWHTPHQCSWGLLSFMLSLSSGNPEDSLGLVLKRREEAFSSLRMTSVFKVPFEAGPLRLTSSHGASLSAV